MNIALSNNLPNYQSSHIVAFCSVVAIHLAIIAGIFSSTSSIIKSQTIQVSLVALSSLNQQKQEDNKKAVPLTKKALATNEAQEKLQKDVAQNTSVLKKTSGKKSPDAVAINSAQTDPIFDAVYLNNPTPLYPLSARRNHIQGKVFLEVMVKTDGLPAEIAILHSSGFSSLDNAALEAVKNWKFVPANRGNQAVSAKVIVPIEFKLS